MKKPVSDCRKGVNKFLKAWKELDYQKMFEASQITWMKENSIEKLETIFFGKIDSTKIVKMEKMAECRYRVTIDVTVKGETSRISLHATCEVAPYKAHPDGTFGVNPESLRNA